MKEEFGLYNDTPVIRTFTGKWVDVFNPDPDTICIEDIAHALSYQCRFAGHMRQFYSVAQHSLNVMYACKEHNFKLECLMHDASEAYLLDIPRPIKKKLSNYAEIEDALMCTIANKFNFSWPMSPQVKKLDDLLLEQEWNEIIMKDFSTEFTFHPNWQVEQKFLSMFKFYSR